MHLTCSEHALQQHLTAYVMACGDLPLQHAQRCLHIPINALFFYRPACLLLCAGLNRTWFFPQPAKGQIPGNHWHAIYAASYRQTGPPFPLAWSPDDNTVPGLDVTQAYLDAPDTWAPTAVAAAAAAAAQAKAAAAALVAAETEPSTTADQWSVVR
jgi:hypothetical protein